MYVLQLNSQSCHVLYIFCTRSGTVFRIQSECVSNVIILIRPLTARINQLESK